MTSRSTHLITHRKSSGLTHAFRCTIVVQHHGHNFCRVRLPCTTYETTSITRLGVKTICAPRLTRSTDFSPVGCRIYGSVLLWTSFLGTFLVRPCNIPAVFSTCGIITVVCGYGLDEMVSIVDGTLLSPRIVREKIEPYLKQLTRKTVPALFITSSVFRKLANTELVTLCQQQFFYNPLFVSISRWRSPPLLHIRQSRCS